MVIVLLGQTASGKTALASNLAEAFPDLVLVNFDAFQVYRDMDIGTAKIPVTDPMRSRYLLMDLVEPSHTFSAKEYRDCFISQVDPLIKSGRNVLMVGGTGLYARASVFDYDFPETGPEVDVSDLEPLSDLDLHKVLEGLDPSEAEKVHPNNRKRVMRAISLIRSTGRRKTDIIADQRHEVVYPDVLFHCLLVDKDLLDNRLKERVDSMFANGLLEEAAYLRGKYELSVTAQKAIGYEEAFKVLDGKMDLEEAKASTFLRTRQYAKRQMTFFRRQFPGIQYNGTNDAFVDISKEIENHV